MDSLPIWVLFSQEQLQKVKKSFYIYKQLNEIQ